MIKLKDLIVDSISYPTKERKVAVKSDDIIFGLKQYYNTAANLYDTGHKLYRKTDGKEYYYYIDPTQFQRQAAETSNFYTLLLDFLPSWKGYPKRSQSVIFSNNRDAVSQYKGNVFNVFPKNDAKLVVCSQSDAWNSFRMLADRLFIYDIVEFNSVFKNIFLYFGIYIDNISNIQTEFFDKIESITPQDILNKVNRELNTTRTYKTVNDIIAYMNGNWIEYFDDLLNPESNNIKLISITELGNYTSKSREMWTDAECLLVRPEFADKLVMLGIGEDPSATIN